VLERLRGLAAEHGERFTPAPLLVEVAERGVTLTYDRAAAPGDQQ
jgi:hypothetical protein